MIKQTRGTNLSILNDQGLRFLEGRARLTMPFSKNDLCAESSVWVNPAAEIDPMYGNADGNTFGKIRLLRD